ncbi:hypothetical protein [Sphingosinicella sp. BN140058]|uniref:hypothetical protein n=1 Tax=Sphingosinicella sp. BN140058 TaxID=1892855 RepID=UPI001010ED99|nr:hypothetical protein [Sphingosinicella sp. BN140058]QAY80237.1 hypothetical protein ETR14_26705 [Sphingosinicella sp. BN140058]
MRKFIRTVRRLALINSKKPHIEISDGGWKTSRPQVHVSIRSAGGTMGIASHPADDAGNARCTMLASSMENILGLAVVDRRAKATNEAQTGRMTEKWHSLARDAAADLVPAHA